MLNEWKFCITYKDYDTNDKREISNNGLQIPTEKRKFEVEWRCSIYHYD